jgi:hypothetical protein
MALAVAKNEAFNPKQLPQCLARPANQFNYAPL